MGFREQIQEIVDQSPGAVICSIMGYDGIPIDTYAVGGGDLDLNVLLTECTASMTQLHRSVDEQPALGMLADTVVAGTQFTTITRRLTKEYFIAIMVKTDGLPAKARYLLRVHAPKLVKELS